MPIITRRPSETIIIETPAGERIKIVLLGIKGNQAQVIIEQWRRHYNTRRPHSSLGYRPPAPVTISSKPTIVENRRTMQ